MTNQNFDQGRPAFRRDARFQIHLLRRMVDPTVHPAGLGRTVAYRASAVEQDRFHQQDQQKIRRTGAAERTRTLGRRNRPGTGHDRGRRQRVPEKFRPAYFDGRSAGRGRGFQPVRRAEKRRIAQPRPRTDDRIPAHRDRTRPADAHSPRGGRDTPVFRSGRPARHDAGGNRRDVRSDPRACPADQGKSDPAPQAHLAQQDTENLSGLKVSGNATCEKTTRPGVRKSPGLLLSPAF